MADLGAIGIKAQDVNARVLPLDTAYAWNAANNPVCCISFMQSKMLPKNEDWKTLSGIVKNSTGIGISRRVMAIDSRDGALRGITTSAVDGTFAFKTSTAEPVMVIAVPDLGDQRNALIYDAVIPV